MKINGFSKGMKWIWGNNDGKKYCCCYYLSIYTSTWPLLNLTLILIFFFFLLLISGSMTWFLRWEYDHINTVHAIITYSKSSWPNIFYSPNTRIRPCDVPTAIWTEIAMAVGLPASTRSCHSKYKKSNTLWKDELELFIYKRRLHWVCCIHMFFYA